MLALPLGALLSPLSIVAVSIVLILVAIAVFRLHAFFALLLAAALVALLSATGQTGDQRFNHAINAVMTEFGAMAGNLGCSIALAAVIGIALMQSGAADKIVRRLIAVLGENRAGLVLCGCSFILSGPVFVDTVFMLMLPIARALAMRTGRDYTMYVMAIGAGAVVANGVIPPAPGPLVAAATLKIEIGRAIFTGLIFGVLPALAGLGLARWFNRRVPIPPRPLAASVAQEPSTVAVAESELPGFWVSIAPVVLPLALILLDACVNVALTATAKLTHPVPSTIGAALRFFGNSHVAPLLHFLGNKNVALFVGAVIALTLQARRRQVSWRKIGTLLGGPLETAGIIILIVSAGGAYGMMIKNAGVGAQLQSFTLGAHPNHPLIAQLLTGLIHHQVLLAWLVTLLIRGAQGSATVATITGAGLMVSIAGPAGFTVNPLYIFLAIGFGSKGLSWMNDAGFWIVSRMSGLTQGEMLRTWSPVLTLISVFGLIEVLIASSLWPQLPF
jgi:gluconate:H+ symporter, GntP family